MNGLLEAKRVLHGGTAVVLATVPGVVTEITVAPFVLRIVQIRREGRVYYGKELVSGTWWPIVKVEVVR
jgi:hypothetical protein